MPGHVLSDRLVANQDYAHGELGAERCESFPCLRQSSYDRVAAPARYQARYGPWRVRIGGRIFQLFDLDTFDPILATEILVQSTPSHVSRGKPASSRKPIPSTVIASRPSSFNRRRIAWRVAQSSWKSSPVFEPRAPPYSIKIDLRPPVPSGSCQARPSSALPRTSRAITQRPLPSLQTLQTYRRDNRLHLPTPQPRLHSRRQYCTRNLAYRGLASGFPGAQFIDSACPAFTAEYRNSPRLRPGTGFHSCPPSYWLPRSQPAHVKLTTGYTDSVVVHGHGEMQIAHLLHQDPPLQLDLACLDARLHPALLLLLGSRRGRQQPRPVSWRERGAVPRAVPRPSAA